MLPYQIWLGQALLSFTAVGTVMRTQWGWPIAETIHFIGLTLLVGTVGFFDLRLLGMGQRIPIAAAHRLIPWGLFGFALTAVSGVTFLMTEPDQYLYNPSFHFKMLFLAIAGANALTFYLTTFRDVAGPGASAYPPLRAKVIAAISLSMWMGVIIGGRLLTFYRPAPCEPPGPGFLSTCLPGDYSRYTSPRDLKR